MYTIEGCESDYSIVPEFLGMTRIHPQKVSFLIAAMFHLQNSDIEPYFVITY
jgi:hypothetical protein